MTTHENHPPVIVTREDGVIQLAINAPQSRNSLQAPGVLNALLAGLDELENTPALRSAVITGTDGAFCSGGDLRQLAVGTEDEIRARMTRNTWLYRRIALSPKLIVAAVDGPAYGAGLGLAACCDLIVAGQTGAFCCAFTRVGAMPDAALFWSLPARVGVASNVICQGSARRRGACDRSC
jgi:2-(1,2-epoxy-1,2-dihydrophenyl)acetyl-CoA isomerase